MHKILYTKHKRKIAYKHYTGKSTIGFTFLSGLNSYMNGNKAKYIFDWCIKNKIECTLFDYSGHGKSSENFKNCDISSWIEDTVDILNEITLSPQILIGSSMGGWLAIKLALLHPSKIKGLITIAAAPDFTKTLWEKELTLKQKDLIIKKGFITIPSPYNSNGYIITKRLIQSGRKNFILKRSKLKLECPIRLIHGENDKEVDWTNSLNILKKLAKIDADLIIIKNGDHRLSNKNNLKKLTEIAYNLFKSLET